MAHQPGCGLIFAPSQYIDRRQSLRRSFSMNHKSTKSSSTNKPSHSSLKNRDIDRSSIPQSMTLAEKMRAMNARKQREHDILSGRPPTATLASPVVRKNPRHLDLMEAASQNGYEATHRQGLSNDKVYRDVGTGKENMASDGQSPRNHMDQSCRQIAYNQYLTQAFGLSKDGKSILADKPTTTEKPLPAAVQRLKPTEGPTERPDSDASARTADSMEVNFHMASKDIIFPSVASAKDRRPKIQVQIPDKRSQSSQHLAGQINRRKTTGRTKDTPSAVSPPSTILQRRSGEVPARLSIVSPLSVVEMPRPRRPFSAISLEDMTNGMPRGAPLLEKSTSSDSSEDTGEHDDRSSNYSTRSSMSSLEQDPTVLKPPKDDRKHSMAFSIISPAAAGIFDSLPSGSLKPKNLCASKSTSTLALNMNKPLPPEPSVENVAPLRFASRSRYRASSMHGRRKAPTPLTISRSSVVDLPSQVPSRISSLRSRYTPADLDALDAAFENQSPQVGISNSQPEATLMQAQLALEAHLGTITEDESDQSITDPLVHDPLQISRGPNDMVPSRQAPPPPSNALNLKLSDGSVGSRKRLHKRSSVHVATQIKLDPSRDSTELLKMVSAPVGNLRKANQILGKPDEAPVMEREISSESNCSSNESPETYGDSSSPYTSSREASSTPETEASSVPDHAFEEIRARLELLSPKNDLKTPFSFDHTDTSDITSSAIPMQEQSADQPSQTTPRANPSNVEEPTVDPSTPEIQLTPSDEINDPEVGIPIALDTLIQEQIDESNIHPLQRRGAGLRSRSPGSIAVSEIREMYATLPSCPSPGSNIRQSMTMTAEEEEHMISADAAERVLYQILKSLDNLQDLFATATVSRGFYRIFKRHELPLMKNALWRMSPAAWELREMSPSYPGLHGEDNASPRLDYSPSLYLQHYMRDMYTMIALKSMILIHCESFLRADTITALAGGETERASQIDDAFWRVWTFCQVFGCGSNREDDIVGQMDWLRGGVVAKQQKQDTHTLDSRTDINRNSVMFSASTSFGQGNADGLSTEDLYDMTEIWTCLGVLVRGFQGKRQEARDVGIFQTSDIADGDVEQEDAVLEEWTYHLLTLSPPTVLDVTSPTSPTAATFAHARSRGYTTWIPPPVSRATFLKEALSRVYQEKVSLQHPSTTSSSPKATISTPSSPTTRGIAERNDVAASRWRCVRHAAEIRAKRNDPTFKEIPASEDRPMSNYPAVLEKLDLDSAPPVPALPKKSIHRLTASETDTSKSFISALVVPRGPQVRDPVDVAVERLVGMGFEKKKAAKALADTDTGNSIDFEGALETLVRERKRDVECLMHERYRGPVAEGRVSPVVEGLGLRLGSGSGSA